MQYQIVSRCWTLKRHAGRRKERRQIQLWGLTRAWRRSFQRKEGGRAAELPPKNLPVQEGSILEASNLSSQQCQYSQSRADQRQRNDAPRTIGKGKDERTTFGLAPWSECPPITNFHLEVGPDGNLKRKWAQRAPGRDGGRRGRQFWRVGQPSWGICPRW